MELLNYIGGSWQPSSDGSTTEVMNPATEEPMATVRPVSTAADVARCGEGGRLGISGAWADKTPRERSEATLRSVSGCHRGESRRAAALRDGQCRQAGLDRRLRVRSDRRQLALLRRGCSSYRGQGRRGVLAGATSFVRRDPIGVIAAIAPWNYPLNMATWKLGPALATGNTVVLKPSGITPVTAVRLAQLLDGVLPPGVLNVVCGSGSVVGEATDGASRRCDGLHHRQRRGREGCCSHRV